MGMGWPEGTSQRECCHQREVRRGTKRSKLPSGRAQLS